VSRLPNQPFAGKPVALQSAANGALGGGRMQYDLRRAMIFLDALTLNKPEIFIGNCSTRIDAKTGEITDQQTVGFIRQQLAAFAKFILTARRHAKSGAQQSPISRTTSGAFRTPNF
jgi:chromate reductase, NAD(P)H dehydrogenase (quinone)